MDNALVFRVCDVHYAIDACDVQEAILPPERTPIPAAPAVIWGAVNHRGAVYAVVETSLWFSRGQTPNAGGLSARILLLAGHEHQVGLLVDEITTIGEVGHREERSENPKPFESAVVALDNGCRAALLDLEGLLKELSSMIHHMARVSP